MCAFRSLATPRGEALVFSAMTRGPRRAPLRFRRAALIVFVNLAVVLVIAEGGLRLLHPYDHGLRALLYQATVPTDYGRVTTLRGLMESSFVGWRPNQLVDGFVLNSRSLRTREYTTEKAANVYRVVALGDSFTYGGVPTADHWTTLLERGLAAQRSAVEVLRLGVPATGPPFQLRLWQIEGARLRPDLVVLAFFVGNDFFDEQPRAPGWSGVPEQLATVSYTFRALRNVIRLRRGLDPEARVGPAPKPPIPAGRAGGYELQDYAASYDDRRPSFTAPMFAAIEDERLSLCLRRDRWKFDFRFDRAARTVEAMHADVTRAGAHFVIMVIPDQYQVDRETLAAALAHARNSARDYDLALPQRRLAEFCRAHGIDFVDLLPDFRRVGARTPLYVPRDTHWNRAGHLLAAQLLLRHLLRQPVSPGGEKAP
jgi:acetyltransferase AlgX (SGNH hydrolase-like protein)